ncbi:hypothetical protein ACIQVO_10610 [Streptomyces sp. NPDC101062]|uniref:hypothetical protein n=1 Tax=unclassified Streptomyces TaxID=2593676 RepID=UPI00381F7DC4
MTPTSRRRPAAALLLALAAPLLLAAGCRIPGTGVVQAGEPATGVRPVVLLYLVKNGVLYPVARSADVVSTDVDTAVALAFRGPQPAEIRGGVTTELPRSGIRPRVVVDGDRISVELPRQGRLTPLAVDQLVCTVAAARALEVRDAAPAVTVVDRAGRRTVTAAEARCPTGDSSSDAFRPGEIPVPETAEPTAPEPPAPETVEGEPSVLGAPPPEGGAPGEDGSY